MHYPGKRVIKRVRLGDGSSSISVEAK
jgi:hypothetical protein